MLKKIARRIAFIVIKKLPRKHNIMWRYFMEYGKLPNINHPKTFNEKVTKRIVFDNNPLYAELSDKYTVRKYIADKVGEHVLIPLLFTTKNPEDLLKMDKWSGIVVKPNHGASYVKLIDIEPSETEKKAIILEAHKWLSIDFSKVNNEQHYASIEPRIVVEEKITAAGYVPRDFKFHCFKQKDGAIKYVLQVVDGRFGTESRGYYLNSFDNCVWHHGGDNYHLSENEKKSLVKIIPYNKALMDDFDYVRIDWYIIEDNIYFGEMTFTPGSGKNPEFGEELEKVMGDYWC